MSGFNTNGPRTWNNLVELHAAKVCFWKQEYIQVFTYLFFLTSPWETCLPWCMEVHYIGLYYTVSLGFSDLWLALLVWSLLVFTVVNYQEDIL